MITIWEVNCDLDMVHNKEMYWEYSHVPNLFKGAGGGGTKKNTQKTLTEGRGEGGYHAPCDSFQFIDVRCNCYCLVAAQQKVLAHLRNHEFSVETRCTCGPT